MKEDEANLLAQSDKGFFIKKIIFKTEIVWNLWKDSLFETISYKISSSRRAHLLSVYNKVQI